jgi:hypothetical protein
VGGTGSSQGLALLRVAKLRPGVNCLLQRLVVRIAEEYRTGGDGLLAGVWSCSLCSFSFTSLISLPSSFDTSLPCLSASRCLISSGEQDRYGLAVFAKTM